MSRKLDTIETFANTGGGFVISYFVTLWVFPLVGINTNPATAGAVDDGVAPELVVDLSFTEVALEAHGASFRYGMDEVRRRPVTPAEVQVFQSE